MLEAFRARQRPVLRSEGICSFSFLPRTGYGIPPFRAFGPLSRCLESVQASGTRIDRQVAARDDLLVVCLQNSLQVTCEGWQPTSLPSPAALGCAGPERLVTIENLGPEAARYLELTLQRPDITPAGPPNLKLIPVPSGPPYLKFLPLASGLGHPECFQLSYEAAVYLSRLRAGESLIFETSAQRRAMVLAIRGLVQADRYRLLPGDWLVSQGESEISFTAVQASWFLLLDLPQAGRMDPGA